jgi:hypothetical protein
MPRIPEADFGITPSNRVGGINAPAPNTTTSQALAQTANLTHAMAQLQDQSERTDAYAYANEAKRRHLNRKIQYAAALQSVNGDGMTDYIDPTDTNPDVSKRKRIQRPIQEMYKEMVDGYEEDKQNSQKLQRGDIAQELMRGYVGDDLIQTNLQTNKHINRVRTQETTQRVSENLELHLSNYVNHAVSPDATKESINLYALKTRNAISRELGTVGNVIGRKGVEDFNKLTDRALATAASQIISAGVSDNTVHAADQFVARIRDPGQRQAATMRLENLKKSTTTVANLTLLNSNKDIKAHVDTIPALDDITYAKGMENVKHTLGMYTNDKYSMVTDEHKFASASDLASTLLSKRWMQQNVGNDMTFLNATLNGSRAPSAIDKAEKENGMKLDDLRKSLNQEMDAAGITGMFKGNEALRNSVTEMAIAKMRTQQATIGDNLVEIIKANKPGLVGRPFVEEVMHAANAQGAGDVPLVGKKERVAFQQNFDEALVKDPGNALDLFNQQLANAGTAFEGEASYRRRMAQDLVSKNPKYSYLAAVADADPVTQFEMVKSAAKYQSVLKEVPEVSDATFQEAFVSSEFRSGIQSLRDSSPVMYEGIKQAIFHDAANYVKSKGDVKGAVEKATEKMKGLYTSISAVDGSSSILALNRGTDFSKAKAQLSAGALHAVQLPWMSREEKIDILERYGKRGVLDYNGKAGAVSTPDHAIDFHLRNLVTIQPDGAYPNMHVLKIGDAPISKKDGTRIKISAQQILEYGASAKAKQDAEREAIRTMGFGNRGRGTE